MHLYTFLLSSVALVFADFEKIHPTMTGHDIDAKTEREVVNLPYQSSRKLYHVSYYSTPNRYFIHLTMVTYQY